MKLLVRLVLAASTFVPAGLVAGEKPTAMELLEQYRKSVEPLGRARVVSTYKPLYPADPPGAAMSLREVTLVRDGSRMKLDDAWTMTDFRAPEHPTTRQESQSVGSTVDGAYSQINVQRTKRPDRPTVTENRDGNDRRLWHQMGPVRLVFGRMDGDGAEPLWQIMSEAGTLELEPQTEQIDGVETHIVTSRGKYGKHRVWFDPSRGALPRRIEVHKQVGDLWNDEQLGSRPVGEGPARPGKAVPTTPAVVQQEMVYRVDNFRIEEKGSTFVAMAFDTSVTITIGESQTRTDRGELRVERVELFSEPLGDAAFQFDPQIPNKTPVFVFKKALLASGNPAFDHVEVWLDGRVQPKPGN